MTTTTFLKIDDILAFGILLVLLSPWVIPSDCIFPYQFRVTLYAILFCFLLLFKLALTKSWHFSLDKRDSIAIFYLLYLMLRTWIEDSNRENFFGLISLLFLYLYFRLCTLKQLWIFISAIPIICMPQLIYSMYNQADYYEWNEKLGRIFGSFFNTSVWGSFCSFILLVGISCVMCKSLPRWLKVIHCVTVLLWAVLVWESNARTAWLAVLGGGIGLFYFRSSLAKRKKVWIIFLCLVLLLSLLFYLYTYKQSSADGRLLIWGACIDMWSDKPFWGWGIGNFCHSYMSYQTQFLISLPIGIQYLADETQHTFNEYLQVGVEQGCIGLILLIGIISVLFLNRQNREYSSIEKDALITCRCFFIVLGICACFSYPFYFNQIKIICILFLALNNAIPNEWKVLQVNLKNSFRRICLILLCVFSISSCYQCFVYHRAHSRWYAVLLEADTEKGCSVMDNLYPLLRNTPYFLYSCGTMLNFSLSKQAISILQEAYAANSSYHTIMELGKAYYIQKDFLNAEKAWYRASAMIPHKFKPYYCLMEMYEEMGDTVKAKNIAIIIRNKPEKVHSAKLNEIRDEAERIISK